MEPIVSQIHNLLLKSKKTIAVAESCTGGTLSELLTKTPGSSKYFILAIVSYSNDSKEKLLGIAHNIIIKHGAVSSNVASQIADKVRKIAKTDLGIGITGIAGPGGGRPEKPVGTVFIAVASQDKNICRRFFFKGSRRFIRKKAALKSLQLLKNIINAKL